MTEVIGLAVRHGCGAVELRSAASEFLHVGLPDDDLDGLRADLVRAGIRVLSVTSYVGLCTPAVAPGADDQLDDLVAHIWLAHRIGAHGVRVFMRDRSGFEEAGPTVGERLALRRLHAVASVCAETGVSVLVETHDSHALGAKVAAFLGFLEAEDPDDASGVIWDTTHTWAGGEDPATTLHLLGRWLAYIQLQDNSFSAQGPTPVLPGTGSYPIDDFAAAIHSSSWAGWLSLEWERAWHPELPPLDLALAAMPAWAHDRLTIEG